MLQPGQKIMVKQNLRVDNFYGGSRFHNGMSKYCGLKGFVRGHVYYDSSKYSISVDPEGYDWTEAMLTVIE